MIINACHKKARDEKNTIQHPSKCREAYWTHYDSGGRSALHDHSNNSESWPLQLHKLSSKAKANVEQAKKHVHSKTPSPDIDKVIQSLPHCQSRMMSKTIDNLREDIDSLVQEYFKGNTGNLTKESDHKAEWDFHLQMKKAAEDEEKSDCEVDPMIDLKIIS
jgi:hypothetical protein